MNIIYFQENKVTKKTSTKTPLVVTKEGLTNDEGEIKSYWDFFKDFENQYVNITVTCSNKFDLEESDSDEESEE